MKNLAISFVIPAYNEEKYLPETLDCINKYAKGELLYEVLVVDNQSTDKTVECAKRKGANVYIKDADTVAALRNYGVTFANGDILIFIDADVLITKKWAENINKVIIALEENSCVITGSWVGVPEKSNWIENYWFKPLVNKDATHINSGHMIIHRAFFSELNGFDESLETGEDYDISMRAIIKGANIENNPELFVVHQGFPKDIKEFFSREIWHGKGDYVSISTFLNSTVALLSMVFLLAHAFLIGAILFWESRSIFTASLVVILFIPFASATTKYRNDSSLVIAINIVLYYIYFWARCLSFFHRTLFRKGKKRER